MKRLALLALAAIAIGCGPKVRTDCQRLGRAIGPDSRIRCVADFAVLRWQKDGLILSTMEALPVSRRAAQASSRGCIASWARQHR